MRALVAWRGGLFFDRRKDRGVVCVFSIFDAGGSVRARSRDETL